MPYKNLEDRRTYNRNYHRAHKEKDFIYYRKNRDRILLNKKKYWAKTRAKRLAYQRKFKLENPWMSSYTNARTRCTNRNNQDYKTYGAKGIKFLLTIDDIKHLWYRDKAYLLKSPTIDRMDNDWHYCIENCEFIERSENATKGNYEARWK